MKEHNANVTAMLLNWLVTLVIDFISGKFFVDDIAASAVKG